jgi:hypothetical protein
MTEDHPDYVSVFLAYKGDIPIHAWFQFTFIDTNGTRTVVFQDDDAHGLGLRVQGLGFSSPLSIRMVLAP